MSNFLNFSNSYSLSIFFILFQFSSFLVGCRRENVEIVKEPKINSNKAPILISIDPAEGARKIKRNAKIVLSFNEPLDPMTLSVNTNNNECSGTIQISTNEFKRCVRMNPISLRDSSKKVILSPAGIYAAQKFHKIRLNSKIKNLGGLSLKKGIITKLGFQTSWSKQFGTSGNDTGLATTVDMQGNIYLAGQTVSDKRGKGKSLFLAKYSPSGLQHWIQDTNFGRPITAAVLQIKQKDTIRLSAYSHDRRGSAAIISKFDGKGREIFSKTFTFTGTSIGKGLAMDKNGNIFIPAASPFNILKILKNGKKSWGTELSSFLKIQALAVDSEKSLYVSGNMKNDSNLNASKKETNIFLLKISQQGPKHWHKYFRNSRQKYVSALATKSTEAVTVIGSLYSEKKMTEYESKDTKNDVIITNYNSVGERVWSYILKGMNSEHSTVAKWTPDGHLLIGGFTDSNLAGQKHSGKEDVFLAKFNSSGILVWLRQFGTSENERPYAITTGLKGQIYITGYTEGQMDGAKYNGGRDIFLVKFNKDGEKM